MKGKWNGIKKEEKDTQIRKLNKQKKKNRLSGKY